MRRPRADVDDSYQWDPTTIYESPAERDREYETATDHLERIRESIAAPPDDADSLARTLDAFERLVAARQRLTCEAERRRTMDLTDEEARAFRERVVSLEADVEALATDLRRYIRAHADRIDEVRTDDGDRSRTADGDRSRTADGDPPRTGDDPLDPFDRFLADARREPEHDPALSNLLEAFGDVFDPHDRILTAICDEDFSSPTVEGPDGDPVSVPWFGRAQLLKRRDRAFRRRVHEAFHDAVDDRANAIATAWIEKLRSHARLAEARGFDSIREMALSKPSYPYTGVRVSLPVSVHDALCETVSANLDPYHRSQAARREHLGVETLRPWDRRVPITNRDEPEIPYEEACEHVLAAVEPLGVAYRRRLEAVLEDRRVDVYPAENKREVTYCLSASGSGAFVSLWYDDGVRSLFHLAHELGHAMETECRGDVRRPLYETTPRPVEEVPSVVHELLLADHLLAVGDEPLRDHVLNRVCTIFEGNLYGSTRWARFTRSACRAVERGKPLSRERLDSIDADLRGEFQPVVDPVRESPSPWLTRAHVREPYHSYQYVLGVAGAVAVVDGLERGTLSTAEYREFLEFGGTAPSLEQFEHLGIDASSAGPYERAAARFEETLDAIDGGRDPGSAAVD